MTRRIGRDVKLSAGGDDDAFATLHEARAAGLDAVLLRTVTEVTPTLDAGVLAELRAVADDLDLTLELGVGKINPYMTAELPAVRRAGDGSYLTGMKRAIAACAAIGCNELWTATANYHRELRGRLANDRFRTDAPWRDQLAATRRFLERLAPCLRAHGCRLNVETHEEITTAEVLELVEAVGEDVVGVTLDPANVLVRGEDPLAATCRVAPYVHLTHLRDAALCTTEAGIGRFLAPCGEGVIDWPALLASLERAARAAPLLIEGAWPQRAEMALFTSDPVWQADLDANGVAEIDAVHELADAYEKRVAAGVAPGLEALRDPMTAGTRDEFVARSAHYLRTCATAALGPLSKGP